MGKKNRKSGHNWRSFQETFSRICKYRAGVKKDRYTRYNLVSK